jgi:hypothetical protein
LFYPGILATITRIRDAELADPHGTRHPRTTPSDDASAITCLLDHIAPGRPTADLWSSTPKLDTVERDDGVYLVLAADPLQRLPATPAPEFT